MPVSRRKFLQQGAILAACTAAIPVEAVAQDRSARLSSASGQANRPDVLEHLSLRSFAAVTGSSFKVYQDPADPMYLTLLTAEDMSTPNERVSSANMAVAPPRQKVTMANNAFRLHFVGPSSRVVKQDTFTFEHSTLGTFDLFIVPSGDGQPSYSAIINRMPTPMPVHAQRLR